ncbi:MAG: hypothetical protein JSV88_15920 [Candidatus Aminicenantes bacterium]|nr:MAG: hypothetical protein JSV88_15920 [Candidatus Aminicenantes bacterium]
MGENEEMRLNIEVLSGNRSDTANVAVELEKGLGKAAAVQLKTKQIPKIPTRGVDTGLILQVIQVTLFAAETAILLAALLKGINKKKTGGTLMISNSKTGKKVEISEKDSLKKIEKKIRKVLKKEGLKVLFEKE